MFTFSMPPDFNVGSSTLCRINGKSAPISWPDRKTLIIDGDVRTIISASFLSDGRVRFTCADGDLTPPSHIPQQLESDQRLHFATD
jgi:hypothetical protein